MAGLSRFEELKCWQASRELLKTAYTVSEQGKLKTDWDTRSQFRRAALSTMNNIAEGFGRYSNKEFIRFLDISQSSAREVKSMLYVFEDLSYLKLEEIQLLHEHIDKVISLTIGLIKYLQNNPRK